jgi:CheY-like chemotaxis protein
MRSNGNALLTLINDILDLARVERGLLSLELTELDIHQVISTTIDLLTIRAKSQGLQLLSRIDPRLSCNRIGDPLRLRQILINLVGNAIKFTPAGSITISVQPSGEAADELLFAIADTGIGIPKDKLNAIFASFTQADSSTARRYGGSGLGLAIVTRLVALMDGRIWVESQEGRGSTFFFTARLPQHRYVPEDSTAEPAPSAVSRPALLKIPEALGTTPLLSRAIRPLHILIVDDSIDNRFLLKSFLRRLPHTLVEADNGLRAVEMVTSQHFDLVLMDMQMPVMDGYIATRRIREWEATHARPAVPIVALTASALNEDVSTCLAAGCDFHVSKPINRATLIETITRAAQHKTPAEADPNPSVLQAR